MDPFRSEGFKRTNTILKAGAGKMVAEGKGLPRTLELRKLLADTDGLPIEGEDIASAVLFTKTDTEFIWQLSRAFREEFLILSKAKGATVERGDNIVIGSYGDDPNNRLSPSQLIFKGAAYSEVDRTIVGILCMKWILTDDYETFTTGQPGPIKLSKEDFTQLRMLFLKTFENTSSAYMLIVSMIVNDLGKSDQFRSHVKNALEYPKKDLNLTPEALAAARAKVKTANHDEIIYLAAKFGALKLINEFDGEKRERLELGIQFGGMMNCGQLAQAENVPGSFKGITQLMGTDLKAFPMKFLEVVLDVAGAQGHVDSRGAKSWIAPVNTAYGTARECVLDVISGAFSAREAYDRILDNRAQLLFDNGFQPKLSTEDSRDRALLRILLMFRASRAEDAQKVAEVLDALPTTKQTPPLRDFLNRPIDNVREALINGLTVDGYDDGLAIIPYYAPGLLSEITRVTKVETREMQQRALAAMFRLMARAFVGTRPDSMIGEGVVLECDLNTAQDRIRDREFLTRPEILDNMVLGDVTYSGDVEALVKRFYGLRPHSSRGNPASPTQ